MAFSPSDRASGTRRCSAQNPNRRSYYRFSQKRWLHIRVPSNLKFNAKVATRRKLRRRKRSFCPFAICHLGEGKMAVTSYRLPLALGSLLAFALALGISSSSQAADWAFSSPRPAALEVSTGAFPCSVGAPFWAPPAATAEELPWRSVWLGHFSGGRPYKDPYFGLTLIDWLDLKICFPARHTCEAWVKDLRRAYHQPEGYWTCLLLR